MLSSRSAPVSYAEDGSKHIGSSKTAAGTRAIGQESRAGTYGTFARRPALGPHEEGRAPQRRVRRARGHTHGGVLAGTSDADPWIDRLRQSLEHAGLGPRSLI